MNCFKKAAVLNDSYGYYFMGIMYVDKRLNNYNKQTAIKYFKVAAQLGNKKALEKLNTTFMP